MSNLVSLTRLSLKKDIEQNSDGQTGVFPISGQIPYNTKIVIPP